MEGHAALTRGICPFAVWRPTKNHGYGGINENVPYVFVDHVMGGYKSTMDNTAWLDASGISSHFGIGVDGSISQYVSIFEAAYCQGLVGRTSPTDRRGIDLYNRANPFLAQIEREAGANWHSAGNSWTLSIGNGNAWNIRAISTEHEGLNQNTPWTDAMVEADIRVKQWCNEELVTNGYSPIPYSTEGIVGHCDIDHINRAYCPGPGRPLDRIIARLNEGEAPEEDDYTMAQPVWAYWKDGPPAGQAGYKTYLLFAGPSGLKKDYVESAEQEAAFRNAGIITRKTPKPMALADLKAFAGSPEPDA